MSRRRRKHPGCGLVLVALGLLAAAQLLIPPWYARRLAGELQREYAPAGTVTVQVRAFPFFELGRGWIDALTVTGTRLEIGGQRLDGLRAELRGVRVAAAGENLPSLAAETGRVEATLGQPVLNAYLTAHLPDALDLDLQLHPEQVTLAGRIRFVGRLLNFFTTGRLVPAPENRLAYRVDKITLEGIELPSFLQESAQALFDGFSFPLGPAGLFGPLTVAEVITAEDTVTIVFLPSV